MSHAHDPSFALRLLRRASCERATCSPVAPRLRPDAGTSQVSGPCCPSLKLHAQSRVLQRWTVASGRGRAKQVPVKRQYRTSCSPVSWKAHHLHDAVGTPASTFPGLQVSPLIIPSVLGGETSLKLHSPRSPLRSPCPNLECGGRGEARAGDAAFRGTRAPFPP